MASGSNTLRINPRIIIGILCLLTATAVILVIRSVTPEDLGDTVVFAPGDAVFFKDGATRDDAQHLGEVLKKVDYFNQDSSNKVALKKKGERYILSFVVEQDAWFDKEMSNALLKLGTYISAELYEGRPVIVQMCDVNLKVHKVIDPAELPGL